MDNNSKSGSAPPDVALREALALTKALLRSAQGLGMTNQDLAALLGADEAKIGRFANDGDRFRPESHEWEVALMAVEIYTALFRLVGGNEAHIGAWMRGYNRALDASPLELIGTLEGLGRVRNHLRAAVSLS